MLLDAAQQVLELVVAIGNGILHIDQFGMLLGEKVFVLEPGNFHAGRDPAVALAVHADEDVALLEVGPVERARRVRSGAQLEEHRRQLQVADRLDRCAALVRQLQYRRADEYAQSLVGSADHCGADAHERLRYMTGFRFRLSLMISVHYRPGLRRIRGRPIGVRLTWIRTGFRRRS